MATHIFPRNEARSHKFESDGTCNCDPLIEYIDPETGLPYVDAPLVVHQSPTTAIESDPARMESARHFARRDTAGPQEIQGA
jgi:hypothetical protein